MKVLELRMGHIIKRKKKVYICDDTDVLGRIVTLNVASVFRSKHIGAPSVTPPAWPHQWTSSNKTGSATIRGYEH